MNEYLEASIQVLETAINARQKIIDKGFPYELCDFMNELGIAIGSSEYKDELLSELQHGLEHGLELSEMRMNNEKK